METFPRLSDKKWYSGKVMAVINQAIKQTVIILMLFQFSDMTTYLK